MPLRSKAQSRFFEMVAHDPAAAQRVGVPQDTAKKFLADSHGQTVSNLPDRVKKAEGGAVKVPPPFRW